MAKKNQHDPLDRRPYTESRRDPLDCLYHASAPKNNKNTNKNPLTKQDALSKMCSDIRQIAEVNRYGTIWYPTKANPSIVCTVHSGKVTECHILFINAMHDQFGTPNIPDASTKYRSD